jgi:hypothetical protein
MDRDRLKAYLERGPSLPQIGALENRDPSTVGYWVKKHGLVANGSARYSPRPKEPLTREQLEPLVRLGMPARHIAKRLNRNPESIRRAIARHGLPQPIEVRRAEVHAAVESGATEIVRRCRRHGETEFALVGSEKRPRCKLCRSEAVARRRRKVKQILVEEAGGRCVLCGYSQCLDALEFHHRDPKKKEFGVAARGITRSIEAVRAEAAKCVLLCSNCHAEVEGGHAEVPPLQLP